MGERERPGRGVCGCSEFHGVDSPASGPGTRSWGCPPYSRTSRGGSSLCSTALLLRAIGRLGGRQVHGFCVSGNFSQRVPEGSGGAGANVFPNERKGEVRATKKKNKNKKKRKGKGEREEREARENCPTTRNDERAAQRILELKDRAAEQTDGKLGRRTGKPGMELTGGWKGTWPKGTVFFLLCSLLVGHLAP